MIDIIKKYLLKIIDNIDAGNSNLIESEAVELVDTLKRLTDVEAVKYISTLGEHNKLGGV